MMKTGNTTYKAAIRIALATGFLLLLPLLAMQFTNEVVWDRDWNHRCHHRALPATWNGTGDVRDGTRSDVGPSDCADYLAAPSYLLGCGGCVRRVRS